MEDEEEEEEEEGEEEGGAEEARPLPLLLLLLPPLPRSSSKSLEHSPSPSVDEAVSSRKAPEEAEERAAEEQGAPEEEGVERASVSSPPSFPPPPFPPPPPLFPLSSASSPSSSALRDERSDSDRAFLLPAAPLQMKWRRSPGRGGGGGGGRCAEAELMALGEGRKGGRKEEKKSGRRGSRGDSRSSKGKKTRASLPQFAFPPPFFFNSPSFSTLSLVLLSTSDHGRDGDEARPELGRHYRREQLRPCSRRRRRRRLLGGAVLRLRRHRPLQARLPVRARPRGRRRREAPLRYVDVAGRERKMGRERGRARAKEGAESMISPAKLLLGGGMPCRRKRTIQIEDKTRARGSVSSFRLALIALAVPFRRCTRAGA